MSTILQFSSSLDYLSITSSIMMEVIDYIDSWVSNLESILSELDYDDNYLITTYLLRFLCNIFLYLPVLTTSW